MKKILQIFIILISPFAFACDCDEPSITEKYIQSEFVADVTIIKIYKNKKDSQGYKADIKINHLYKGSMQKSIYVDGRSDNQIGTSCDIFIPEGKRFIAYARKDKQNNLSVGMCSGILYFDQSYRNRIDREIKILETLEAKNINFTSNIYFRNQGLSEHLKQFKGLEVEKEFGLFEISFNKELTINDIKIVSGFGQPIDQKLLEIFPKTEWYSNHEGVENEVPENTKLLIGIYYYPPEKKYSGFLSQYY